MVAFCRRLDLRCETGQPESVADTPFITAAPGRLDSAIHGNSDSADSICRRLHVPRRHSESVPQPWGFLLRGWAARVASSTRHVRVRLSEWSGGHIRAARWSKRATVPPERSRAIIGARPIPTCRPESAFSRRSRAMRSWRGLCWNNRLTERGATEFCHQLAGIPQTDVSSESPFARAAAITLQRLATLPPRQLCREAWAALLVCTRRIYPCPVRRRTAHGDRFKWPQSGRYNELGEPLEAAAGASTF